MPPKQRIILGIDFGTTYSGVAWADSTNPKDITLIRQWPDAVGKQDMDKVPSEMVYDIDGTFKWGYQACTDSTRKSGNILQYMKLLLDPSQEKTSILPDPLGLAKIRAQLPKNKTPVDVIADYLREIKLHALNVLSNQYGTEFWNIIDIEYHLTVPAVWSEAARALTLKAANQAGIGTSEDLILIAEPEAAALYCLTELAPGLLKKGDTFVVVDCGGGTVDLISYKILQREPKLEVKEITHGGKLCGSVFLNRQFEGFMKDRLGAAIFDKMTQKGKPYWRMMTEFDEKLKRKFKASDDQEVMDCPVPGVPDDPKKRIEDGFMEISREEMENVFDPVINHIVNLIQAQVNSIVRRGHKAASTIILVGGFGSSLYLYKRIQEHIQEKKSKYFAIMSPQYGRLNVLQPANAWSAVARGAVICGLQTVEVQSRQARRSYGVTISSPFDSTNHTHVEKYRVYCRQEGRYLCKNLMRWYVRKGDEVAGTQKISFPFYMTSWTVELDEVHLTLYASDSEANQAELYSTHENVYQVCTVTCDMRKCQGVKKTNTMGTVYYVWHYNIVMYIHSAQLSFGMEYNGVQCGTTTVTFL